MLGQKKRLRLDGSDPINNALCAFWPLNANAGSIAVDLSPARKNGTLTAFNPPGWAFGIYGRALTFDGVSNYINVNSRPLNNLASGSFVMRFRPNAGGGILYYEDGNGKNNFAVYCPSPGSSAFVVNIGSNTSRSSTVRTWDSNTWYHVAITWGAEIKIYIDGVIDTTIAASGGTTNVVGDNDQFGRYSFGGGIVGGYSPATIGDTRAFSRSLSSSEIARIYRDPWAGAARFPRRTVYRPSAVYTLAPSPVVYEYTPADVVLTYTPAPPPPDTGDTHDGIKRRTRRQRAVDAAEQRRRASLAEEALALRLSLEAAMGMAAEVAEEAPQEAIQAATRKAARIVPALADTRPDDALLASAREAVAALLAAVQEAERARALAEDDEEVLMLLRAL